jgi:hypothetical protein
MSCDICPLCHETGHRRGYRGKPPLTTFALSGSMRPKQMGIILGFAALRDALLVRLMLVPILLRITGRAAGGCRGGSTSSSH